MFDQTGFSAPLVHVPVKAPELTGLAHPVRTTLHVIRGSQVSVPRGEPSLKLDWKFSELLLPVAPSHEAVEERPSFPLVLLQVGEPSVLSKPLSTGQSH